MVDIDIIHDWVMQQLQDNPKVIGGDSGVRPLLAAYLDTPIDRVAGITSVFRTRQKILELHPELDHRVKDKLKCKKLKVHYGQQEFDFDEAIGGGS